MLIALIVTMISPIDVDFTDVLCKSVSSFSISEINV